jgi:hypothetical protein
VTVVESVDLYVPFAESSTRRLRWTQLRRDDEGAPRLFVLVYVARSALHHEGPLDGARMPPQDRRSKPFLRTWKVAMNHWASGNCDVLKGSRTTHYCEVDRARSSKPTSDCGLVSPGSPARPDASTPVLRGPEPLFDHAGPFLLPRNGRPRRIPVGLPAA